MNIDEIINNSKDEKITFIFSKEEFNTIKIDDSEIKFKGVMYDIISMSKSKDSVTVIVFMDILEGKILEQLENHSKSEQSKKIFKKITGFQFIVPSLFSLNLTSRFQSGKARKLFEYKFFVPKLTLQTRPKPPMIYKTV